MNRLIKIIFLVTILIPILLSCEDPVSVDLPEFEKKISIDAILSIDSTSPSHQFIDLSYTVPYGSNTRKYVKGANVKVTNLNNGQEFVLAENTIDSPAGIIYECDSFVAVSGATYALDIEANGIIYRATEKLYEQVNIKDIWVDYDAYGELLEDENTAINLLINSPDTLTYYILVVSQSNGLSYEFIYFDNKFYLTADYLEYTYTAFVGEDEASKTEFEFILINCSRSFYSYIKKIYDNERSGGNGPFDIPPSIVKGNCANLTNPTEYPMGFFTIVKPYVKTYTPPAKN